MPARQPGRPLSLLRRLRKLAGRRNAARSPQQPATPPTVAQPEAQPVLLPARPARGIDGGIPPVWVDERVPDRVRVGLGSLPTAVDNPAAADTGGVVVLPAGSRHNAASPDSATWWWIDSIDDDTLAALRRDRGEAVLVPDESIREQLERQLPEVVGDTWVVSDQSPPLETVLTRYYPSLRYRYRLGVIGYNLKFIRPIVTSLVRNPGIEATIDEWRVFAAQPSTATEQVLQESDVVLCEWCGPNAVYASRNKQPGQRLIVRLHRFELETVHWEQIDPDKVDRFVTVGDYYRQLVLDRTGWPQEKVVVIGNQVDDLQLRRPKLPDARFRIGLLGASSSRKRLDLALDVIEQVHRKDPRFRLLVKTTLPQDEKWVWDDEHERRYFDNVLGRLDTAPLQELVTIDSFGRDIASWLRNVGFILSVSDDESFHLAPAEGMASGSVPIIRDWPGADSVYSPSWVMADTDTMVERILDIAADPHRWAAAANLARPEAVDAFGLAFVVDRWASLLDTGSTGTLR